MSTWNCFSSSGGFCQTVAVTDHEFEVVSGVLIYLIVVKFHYSELIVFNFNSL